jgi:hypothetical protein
MNEISGRAFAVACRAEADGLMSFGTEGEYITLTLAGVAWCKARGLPGEGVGYSDASAEGLNRFLDTYGREIGMPIR